MDGENSQIEDQLIIKIIRNEADESEKKLFESWLHESESNREKFEELKSIWSDFDNIETPKSPNVDLQWAEVENEVFPYLSDKSLPSRDERLYTRKSTRAALGWLFRAAIIVILFGTYFLIRDGNINEEFQKVKKKEYYTAVTPKGKKHTFTLTDGTKIYLNVATKLKYPKILDKNERIVELNGEAYFDVASDPDRPFKVICGNSVIEVLGTEFNIKNRDELFRVVVTEGKVKTSIADGRDSISLTRGQMVFYNFESETLTKTNVEIDDYTAWMKNELVFSRTNLESVLKEIELYFNISAEIKNQNAKNKLLTGRFKANSLEQVLTAISVSLNVDIKRTGNKISIY